MFEMADPQPLKTASYEQLQRVSSSKAYTSAPSLPSSVAAESSNQDYATLRENADVEGDTETSIDVSSAPAPGQADQRTSSLHGATADLSFASGASSQANTMPIASTNSQTYNLGAQPPPVVPVHPSAPAAATHHAQNTVTPYRGATEVSTTAARLLAGITVPDSPKYKIVWIYLSGGKLQHPTMCDN